MAQRNNVIGAINLIAFLLSVPIIGAGVWLVTQSDNSCVNILHWPVIILGTLSLLAALAGLVGGFFRIRWLYVIYLVAMFVLIVLLACVDVLVYIVTVRGHGHPVPGRAYLEYDLDDFSWWMKRRVNSSDKWDSIRTCLSSTSMCSDLNQSYRTAQDFFNAGISPLQSGCCKPPTECGYTFVNPTYWISPTDTTADKDCLKWSNNQTQLCYNCDSCKAGLVANLNKEWRRADIVLMIAVIGLVWVYLVGLCTFRKAGTVDHFQRYEQGFT
ncbi:hypothetical protein SAY87_011569 [Trapa incisa]|uniref:Uncharacterized protein n=1 Tax=Trapa incisa TaxID=236973 RepID=A0AAN7GZJ9_9MYRT|nr:hypothetical protein SAY87_011569 [Trapa incisa]